MSISVLLFLVEIHLNSKEDDTQALLYPETRQPLTLRRSDGITFKDEESSDSSSSSDNEKTTTRTHRRSPWPPPNFLSLTQLLGEKSAVTNTNADDESGDNNHLHRPGCWSSAAETSSWWCVSRGDARYGRTGEGGNVGREVWCPLSATATRMTRIRQQQILCENGVSCWGASIVPAVGPCQRQDNHVPRQSNRRRKRQVERRTHEQWN